MPAGARGHYKIQCNARWNKIYYYCINFHNFFFIKLRKMSWIQIVMLEYVVTTSTGTFGS